MRGIGERIRWVREAYEQRWPLENSQEQWAAAFDMQASQLSRFETGKQFPPPDVVMRIVYIAGVSLEYVYFGVLDEEFTVPWLREALAIAHPTQLVSTEQFLSHRAVVHGAMPLRQAQKRQRPLQRKQRKKKKPDDKSGKPEGPA